MMSYLRALRYYSGTTGIYSQTREELLIDQWVRARAMVTYAYGHVPFYRELWSRHGIEPSDIREPRDMRKLPVITKAMLRSAYPKSTLSDQFGRDDYQEFSTSGSTGEPFKFAKDRLAIAKTVAINYRTCTLSGYRIGDRVLQVAPPISAGPGRTTAWVNAVLRRHVVDAFSGDYEATFGVLDSFKPSFIVGYASYIHILAQIALKRSWHPKHRIVAVMTTSETLLPQMRANISEAFDTDVFDQYGSNEFGRMAGECKHHLGYHLNPDSVYIEVLDINNDEVLSIGRPGRLIVTGLINHAMPLIRYEIGDTGAISDRFCVCRNETPLLTGIGGRLQDTLWHADGRPLPPDYLYRILREFDEVRNYQIVQESINSVRVKLVTLAGLSQDSIESLGSAIADYMGGQVAVEEVSEIPRVAGKFKHILSEIRK